MKTVLLLLVVASCSIRPSHGDSAMDKIDKSIAAGRAIMNLLADHKVTSFAHSLLEIGSKVNKYLEGFSPLLGLFQTLLPDSDGTSAQIEEGFARMDAKFDQVFNRLDDLEDKTLEQSLIAQYGGYERKISLLSERLDDYLKSDDSNGTLKYKFLDDYDKNFDDNVRQLYDAMMKTESGVLSFGIPQTVRKITNQHRNDTQLVMKRILHLIIQGVAVELAHHSIVDDEAKYNQTKHDWEERISKLIGHIRDIDEDMQYNYMPQVKKDTSSLLAKMYGQSNQEFADVLYKFLSDKYEWREWVVVVFNDIPSNTYTLKLADNAFQTKEHGRNVIVTSSSKDRKPDISNVKSKLQKIPSGYSYKEYGWWHRFEGWRYKFYNEGELLNKVTESNIGSDYTKGVIRKGIRRTSASPTTHPDLVIKGPGDRYALVTKQNLDMEHSDNYYIGEVRFWMFAIYTDTATRPTRPRGGGGATGACSRHDCEDD